MVVMGWIMSLLKFKPSQIQCWSSNSQYLREWLYLEIGPLKRWLSENEVVGMRLAWCSNLTGVLIKKRRLGASERHQHVRAQRKGHVKTYRDEGHLPAKKWDLIRNQTCQYLDLGLLASRTESKISCCCLSHPVWDMAN